MTAIFTHIDREFPMMHLAIISKNGTIWDISMNERKSPSKKHLFKLPKSCWYHGYSDEKGILYYIAGFASRGELNKHIKGKHEGSKEFNCNSCQHTSSTAYQLKKHKKAIHKTVPVAGLSM